MKELHQLQLEILRKFLFTPSLRYSQAKPGDIENSHFKFHLDKLIHAGFIAKSMDGYVLTQEGKEYANRIDVELKQIKPQPKTSVVVCCKKQIDNQTSYLLYTRLKNPFYGCQGFPTRKVHYGESLIDTAIALLKIETGLEPVVLPELCAIRHYRVYSPEKDLLEDKIMYLYVIDNPSGELHSFEGGEFNWVAQKDVQAYVSNSLEEFSELFELARNHNGNITFEEINHTTAKY